MVPRRRIGALISHAGLRQYRFKLLRPLLLDIQRQGIWQKMLEQLGGALRGILQIQPILLGYR